MLLSPTGLTCFGLALSSLVFYLCARKVNKETLSLDSFMLSDRTLSHRQFSNTFAASSFSLAMTIMFFFSNSKIYGLCMLISPVTYLGGQYFFLMCIRKANVNFKECRTISDLCYKFFPSKTLARLISAMTLTSFIMIVFVELYIGSVVIDIFLPNHILYKTLSFMCIGLLVLCYVRLGGYKALVKTDLWQLTLMIIATLTIFIYAIISPIRTASTNLEVIQNILYFSESGQAVILFCIWLSILNFILPFTQISYWQRVAASESTNTSWQGLKHASWKVGLLFTLPILGFVLLDAKGYDFNDFSLFLITVKNNSAFSQLVLFPLLIVGLCSTVFSSADTAVIAITYTLSDQNTFLNKFSKMGEHKLRKVISLIIIGILMILSIIYWLQFTGLSDWLVPLFYAICGQLVILAPIPIYILFKLSNQNTKEIFKINNRKIWLLSVSIICSWIMLIVSVYLAKSTQNQIWSQLATPIGACLVYVSLLCTTKQIIPFANNLQHIPQDISMVDNKA